MKRFITLSVAALGITLLALSFGISIPGTANAQTVACPAGYTCTPVSSITTSNCPSGYICTSISKSSVSSTVPAIANTSVGSGRDGSCYIFDHDLTIGSTGADVVALQNTLINTGYDISAITQDHAAKGYFGPATAAEVKQYQSDHGVEATGYFGSQTRAYFNRICTTNKVNTTSTATDSVNLVANPASLAGDTTVSYVLLPGTQRAFSFVASAGNDTAYVYRHYTLTDNRGDVPVDLTPNPYTLAGDNSKCFVVPAGSSRTFSFVVNSSSANSVDYLSLNQAGLVAANCGSASGASSSVSGDNDVTISNTSAVLGSPIVVNNQTSGYVFTMSFMVTAGNNTIYMSRDPEKSLTTTSNNSTTKIYNVVASPNTLAGDTSTVIVIPAGGSRTLTYTGAVEASNYQSPHMCTYGINALHYGKSNQSPAAYSVTSGLSNLKMSVTMACGAQTPSNPTSITTTPGGISDLGPSVTNTSVSAKPSVSGSNQSYNVSFYFTVNAGKSNVYLSKPPFPPLEFSYSGDTKAYVQLTDVSASPASIAGDTSTGYLIPAGSSRTFNYTGYINGSYGNGTVAAQVKDIMYGGSADNIESNRITAGLGNLGIKVTFGSGSTAVTPSTNSGVITSAALASASEDQAGMWENFGPGHAYVNQNPADWRWDVVLNLPSSKTINAISVLSNTYGEGWSTSRDTSLLGKELYPLVVFINGCPNESARTCYSKNNTAYGYTFEMAAGVQKIRLYGQAESSYWPGGKLIINFNDGSQASVAIPVSSITPALQTSVQAVTTSPVSTNTSSEASVKVTSPNGGESFNSSNPISVTFAAQPGSQRAYVNLVDSNNAAYDLVSYNNYYYHNVTDPYYSNSGNTSVSLYVPKDWVSSHGSKYLIEVCSSNKCDKSDTYFSISSSAYSSPSATATPTPTASTVNTLTAKCYGSPYNSGVPGVSWSAGVSGGLSPYSYSWSIYNDVSNYGEGGGNSRSYLVNYSTAGYKQAVIRVTDSRNIAVSATCDATIPTYYSATPTASASATYTATASPTYYSSPSPTYTASPSPTDTSNPTSYNSGSNSMDAAIWDAIRAYFNKQR